MSQPESGQPQQGGSSGGARLVIVGAVALVIGALIGGVFGYVFLAGNIRDERDDLKKQVALVTTTRDGMKDKAAACEEAASTAHDQLGTWDNFWNDELEWLASEPGSQTEAEIDLHMQQQGDEMNRNDAKIDLLIAACADAGGSS